MIEAIGVIATLLVLGAIVMTQFGSSWQTTKGWLIISLGFIPGVILGAAILAAYPPLIFLIIIIAASTTAVRKRR